MAGDHGNIRRLPERSVSDADVSNAILDEGFVCHVAYLDDDRPIIVPTLYVRDGTRVLLHGSTAAGFVRATRRGAPMSVSVTHVDGIVVARSGFNSSANYRSVVIHGHGRILEGQDHLAALDLIVNGLIPGRLAEIRPNTESEIRQTATVEIDLQTITTKVRVGPPEDDPADIGTGVWAGIIPLRLVADRPVADDPEVDTPTSVRTYRRPGWE